MIDDKNEINVINCISFCYKIHFTESNFLIFINQIRVLPNRIDTYNLKDNEVISKRVHHIRSNKIQHL